MIPQIKIVHRKKCLDVTLAIYSQCRDLLPIDMATALMLFNVNIKQPRVKVIFCFQLNF